MIADPPVLFAIPGMDETRARDFLLQRQHSSASPDALISRLGSVQDFITSDNGLAVRFEGRVRLGPTNVRRFEVVVGVLDGDSEPYRILAWDSNPPERIRALP